MMTRKRGLSKQNEEDTMKVNYNQPVHSYSGHCDGLIYYYHRRLKVYLARAYAKPRQSGQNDRIAAITRNLWALEPSQGWLYDLDIYRQIHNGNTGENEPQLLSAQSLYIKLMWAMGRKLGLDLATLTRDDIAELPCRTVKSAVEAGLLPRVAGCENFTREF